MSVGLQMVQGGAAGGLGHAHPCDAPSRREGRGELGVERGGDVSGDVLGRGIDIAKWRDVVEGAISEWRDDLVQCVLSEMKVADKAIGIEGGCADGSGDAPVVAMDRLGLVRDAHAVSRGKDGFDGDLVHLKSIDRRCVGFVLRRCRHKEFSCQMHR